MKIWGYLFAVLNMAAAGAFIYFAMQVHQSRTRWQLALLKQELVNRGLPIAIAAPASPDDIDEKSVPFDYSYLDLQYVSAANHQIPKQLLVDVIPAGGQVLGVKPGEVVTNQVDEVKRVQKIIFSDLEKTTGRADKRARLLILLLNLAKEKGREGAYGLLRDFLDDKRRPTARRAMTFLGKSGAKRLRSTPFAKSARPALLLSQTSMQK